jgi:hypothetical protein
VLLVVPTVSKRRTHTQRFFTKTSDTNVARIDAFLQSTFSTQQDCGATQEDERLGDSRRA